MILWTVTFSLVVAVAAVIRTLVKRPLQEKVMGTAAYCLWTAWDTEEAPQVPLQYKGDTTSFVKAITNQTQRTGVAENKDIYVKEKAIIMADSQTQENSAYTSVEEGAQPLLKTVDLNAIVR